MADTINISCKTPANVAETLAKTLCVAKPNASVTKLLILGILAGMYIAFGADSAKYIGVGLSKFFVGGVFSVGLILVVIAGAELFTGQLNAHECAGRPCFIQQSAL